MTGSINPDQIKDLKIFDSASQHLPLCGSHNKELSEEIAGDLDDLVHSHFFQEKFGALFPEDLTGAHLNMRLKDNSLIVQLMREDASGRRLAPEGQAIIIDLKAPADEDTIEINGTILDKADALFRKCQNEHIRSHRSTASPSLRERAVDLTRLSDDDLLDELAARRQTRSHDPIDDLVPTYRRTRSASPDRLESRTRGARENPADTLHGARQAQIDLQMQAERLSRRHDVTAEQLVPLHEQIRRLEQQIQRLTEQHGIPASTTIRASDSTPLLERVLDRLARINERLEQLEGSRTVQTTITPSGNPADSLERPDRTPRREEDTGSRRTRFDSTEQTDRLSQREASLENALRQARQDYLDLQREAERLSRRSDPTIEQLAPLLEQIRRLEHQVQSLTERLGIPVTSIAPTRSDTTPLLERIFSSLDRIDERIGELERSGTVHAATTSSGNPADPHQLPDHATRREEDPVSQRTSSGPTEPTRSPSQREEDLENALRRAREAYLNLQREADLLSRRYDATIEQLAPLHEQIRRLETRVQSLSAQLRTPVTMVATIPSDPVPILERIQDRLSRIDDHLRQLEGPSIVPAETTLSSDRVDSLERERSQLEARLADVSSQISILRERNLELSSQLSTLIAPSPNLPRLTDEQFRMLTMLAQRLGHPSVRDSEDFPFAADTQFLDFPQEVCDSVYFQMYAICNPTRVPDIWRCGEKFFLNQEGLHGTNGLRSLAITRFQLQSLANEFATLGNGQTSAEGLMERFNQLSEEDQTGILRQYQFLHRLSHEPIETTRNSFLSLNDDSANNEERNESISRYLQVQISERYGKMISELTDELNSLTAQLQTTENAYEEALDQLRAEMASLRDQSRLELASAMFRASSLESDLDSAHVQIAQLTGDVSSRDLQVGALQRQVDVAAEQQRLALAEIDRLTRTGRGKDLEIAQLRVHLRRAGEREQTALAEIERLTREGGTKDSRISALEQEALAAAERERLARVDIDRLIREGGTKDSRISALEQDVRKAADLQRDALAEIDRLTREGGTKDSRISTLEREALAAAERERLARLEIDRLTHEGGTKDSRISDLEQNVREAANLQRDALAEIDRLTREGGTKDSRISDLEQDVRDGAERERLARLEIDRLTHEGGTKDSRISDLEQNVREAANLQRDALAEIDRLTREGGTKDSRISDLEQDVREGAERERLARLEIARLTREGGTKDSRISDLEQDVREAADRQRDALAEIDRLKREGGTKDSRISALEQDVREGADRERLDRTEIEQLKREGSTKDLRIADLEQEGGRKDIRIGELEETIRRLEKELKAATADWAEKERLHGVAIGEKDARIEEIAQEYRLLQAKKQDLQEQFEKLIDESDRNDRALNARIAELEKGIRPLITKLQETEFALQEAQAKLEAGTKNFDEMKQRWLKTKKALDEATRIKSALEEESAQHAKAEQAWEKERQRLQRAVATVKEESRLTGIENTNLRRDLDDALQRLDAQVKENRRQALASEKQASELQSTIASLSESLQFEKERSDRFQQAQRETARRVEDLEGQQKDLLRDLQKATEERDELRSEYAKLEPQLDRQREEFGHEIDRVHLEAEERHRAMLEDLERLDHHARALEEELALLRVPRSSASHTTVDLSNPAAAVDEGREAARQLEEIVREISAEPIILSRLDRSLIDGYHLNRQLSQVEEMAFDKSSGALRISITDGLARELRLPRVFTLKPGANEASLGEEFALPKERVRQRDEANRICRLMLIKRLQTIRSELTGAAKGADESKATPWRTWGEVFKNFTTFCKDMNRNLPTLRQHIANYKREFARLRVQGIDEAVLKQCIAAKKIPSEINEPQRGEVAGLIRLYQTMAKSCEEIFLYSLPRKIPMHHAWKILMLTNHGLPDRAYEHGRLKPAEAEVVEPLQDLIPEFYSRFSRMLQSIQIENGRIVE